MLCRNINLTIHKQWLKSMVMSSLLQNQHYYTDTRHYQLIRNAIKNNPILNRELSSLIEEFDTYRTANPEDQHRISVGFLTRAVCLLREDTDLLDQLSHLYLRLIKHSLAREPFKYEA